MSQLSVRRISYAAILCADNAQQLIDEYAAECSVPDAAPQAEMYAAMEAAGSLQCFGAYVGDDLVGFASVLSAIMPHHGKRLATLESIFVSAPYRPTGAGDALMEAAEQHADAIACVGILFTARIGSALDKVLLRRPECLPTHTMYTRWL